MNRLQQLIARLATLEVDALLITNEINVRYLSGFTGDSSSLLVQSTGVTILSDGRYETQIAQECPDLTPVIRGPERTNLDLIVEVISGCGEGKIGIEASDLNVTTYSSLRERCPHVTWIETTGVVESQRQIKDADEIGMTRRAVEIAERSFQSVVPMIRASWTELEIAHQLEANMRTLGAEGVSFPPIVAFGPGGALPHYHPSERTLGDDATLLIDWGACFRGYASDLTRTLHRQDRPSRFDSAYLAVLEAQQAAIEAIKPGVQGSEVDRAARTILEKAGLADAFIHGLGHGIGLEIHESPRMSSICDETLVSGMIVTVEPGVYFEGDFGIRIEDDVLVTDQGHEVLSSLPKGLDQSRIFL